MGAIQGQDYQAALWAIGLRCRGTTQREVEAAIAMKEIVRSWLFRGTLHLTASVDIGWILQLIHPRLVRYSLLREKRLGISSANVSMSQVLFSRALKGGGSLKREEMYKILEDGGITSRDAHGYHLLRRAAWDGVICFGSHDAGRPTFVLLHEWVTKHREFVSREEALAELASRYFTSHGPATIKDYTQWSGLNVSDAKKGVESVSPQLEEGVLGGKTYFMPRCKVRSVEKSAHLLPAFDEYVLGYNDRSAILSHEKTQDMLKAGKVAFAHPNGIFLPTIVIDGRVVGSWRRRSQKDEVVLTIDPYFRFAKQEVEEVERAAERYGKFVERRVLLETSNRS
jgi:hypothetical protein